MMVCCCPVVAKKLPIYDRKRVRFTLSKRVANLSLF
jgi:hypothetical protein